MADRGLLYHIVFNEEKTKDSELSIIGRYSFWQEYIHTLSLSLSSQPTPLLSPLAYFFPNTALQWSTVKHWQHQMLARRMWNRNSDSLLAKMQNGTTTLENSFIVSYEIKHTYQMIQQLLSLLFT